MKFVIDTNVLISAALRDRVPEEVILFVAGRADFQWVVSEDIVKEYKEVIGRDKFNLPPEVLKKWHGLIDTVTSRIAVDLTIDFPRDQTDAKFIACALSAGADYLITGDRDLTEARRLGSTVIISVTMFKKLVCDILSSRPE